MNLQVYENLLLSESSVKTLDSLIFAIDALAPLVPFLGFKA
jgi:hypothetical protein